MASEMVDPINWSHPPPSWAVPPECLVHSMNRCSLSLESILQPSAFEATTLPMRPFRIGWSCKRRFFYCCNSHCWAESQTVIFFLLGLPFSTGAQFAPLEGVWQPIRRGYWGSPLLLRRQPPAPTAPCTSGLCWQLPAADGGASSGSLLCSKDHG